MAVPPYLGANSVWKYLCEFFQRNTDPERNCRKQGEISQVLVEDSLGLHKIFEKFSRNSFFLKFYVRIYTEFGTKSDKFQVKRMSIHPREKSNSFTLKRTFLPALAVMNKKFISNPVGRTWGTNLDQNSVDSVTNVWLIFQKKIPKEYGVVIPRPRVNKTGFPKTKTPFRPVSSFCDLFMNVPPYLGAKYIWKYLCEFFQRNTGPE